MTMLVSKMLTPVLLASAVVGANSLNSCLSGSACSAGTSTLALDNCGLGDDDVPDLKECMGKCGSLTHVFLRNNDLNTLPEHLFDGVTTLKQLYLGGNTGLECVPTTYADTVDVDDNSIISTGTCSCPSFVRRRGKSCKSGRKGYVCDDSSDDSSSDSSDDSSDDSDDSCTNDWDCRSGKICSPDKNICERPSDTDPSACGDPHMTGFRGQKFDFTGDDGAWYALISDLPSMHLNMRVTAPVPSLPEITYITGIALMTTDSKGAGHSIIISVKEPHSLDSACPSGVSPCLADGSLSVTIDGQETLLSPGTVALAQDVVVSAVNLPGACRSFGFEKYWERKKLEAVGGGRRLGEPVGMDTWVLGDPTATNIVECTQYVAEAMVEKGGLFGHQSEHASFQIVTPRATVRLSHGKLHQLAMRDPTDRFDLPDHLTWQMNIAIDHTDVSIDATGILGETFVPTIDARGVPIMHGMESIRGIQEDYCVAGPLESSFAQGSHDY